LAHVPGAEVFGGSGVEGGEFAEAVGEGIREETFAESPDPVADGRSGEIHAGGAAETEDILHGGDSGVGDGGPGSADHVPFDFGAVATEVGHDEGAFAFDLIGGAGRSFTGFAVKPAGGGVVVVRAGVDDAIPDEIMGEELVVRIRASETKLQDAHAGKTEAVAEGFDFGGDEAEVFGDDGEFSECLPSSEEHFRTGTENPASGAGVGGIAGDLPIGLEAAEVIDADEVVETEGMTEAGDPPFVIRLLHQIPAIEGIAPELAGFAEVVGGDAGDDGGMSGLVEVVVLLIAPDVGTVVSDEDGDIADDLYGAFGGVAAEFIPLFAEFKLEEVFELNAVLQFFRPRLQGEFIARREGGMPLSPGDASVLLLDGPIEGVVGEPVLIRLTELIVLFPEFAGGAVTEGVERPLVDDVSMSEDGIEVERFLTESGLRKNGTFQQALFEELVEADEEGVPGEG